MADSISPRPGLLAPSIVLAAGAVLAALVLACTLREFKTPSRTVMVKGYAERQIASDWGVWNVQLATRSAQIQPGYAKIESDAKSVLDFLKTHEVPPTETQVSSISIRPIFKKSADGRGNTNEIELYELGQTITVSSKNVKTMESVSRQVSTLLRAGVELSSHRPSFFYSGIADLKVEMLAQAASDGRHKAERIAQSSGAKVKRLVSAQQGIFQITPVHSFEISDEGSFDTGSIDKLIRAIVTERYAVN